MKNEDLEKNIDQNDEFLTFSQVSRKFPLFSEGALRNMRSENRNNFNKCVRQIGRKVVISVKDFKHWMDSQVIKKN